MKILLVSVNASFSHSSLGIRCLKNYAEQYFEHSNVKQNIQIEYGDFTINQPIGDVLRKIGFSGADMVLFSTYIWNCEFVCKILPDIKKVLPNCLLGAGGPEFSYSAQKYLTECSELDFISFGEGERTFVQLIEAFLQHDFSSKADFMALLSKIKGIYYKNPQTQKIDFTGYQSLIENLDDIPFSYPEILANDFTEINHKIIYYESSRGCPFGCAYCLSSLDKSVRFKSLQKVFTELQIFLDAKIPLVKFVDRTYNLKPERYIEIWRYILEHHNGITMFHFEIEAEFLCDEAFEFLKKVPRGVMQFEMGVQSSNKKTLAAVNRSTNTEKLRENILRIPRTIHQHLDLIAGLPYEDLESFGKSYDYVMDMRPDALQLGFLKVLSGTQMEEFAKQNNWQWMKNPVYECISTPYVSFAEMNFLKEIEILTDAYWNKEIFPKTMNYIFRQMSPWAFMCKIHDFASKKGAFLQARKDLYWFEIFAQFVDDVKISLPQELKNLNFSLIENLLRYDFVQTGKKGAFPAWYEHRYDKEQHRKLLDQNDLLNNSRIGFAFTEFEIFDFDVESDLPENNPGKFEVLIKYKK